jgi:cytochrome b pre-mRNA-processing protein 3
MRLAVAASDREDGYDGANDRAGAGMILRRLFGRNALEGPARALYETAVRQAREPAFYAALGVPDSVDGRFELVALHGFLLMRRLKSIDAGGGRLAQALFDIMFADMDASLREMGAGDLGVGKRVKTMAKGFLGRIAAYETGLENPAELQAALRRNLYGTVEPSAGALAAMAGYAREAAESLKNQPDSALLAGIAGFPPPPAPGR